MVQAIDMNEVLRDSVALALAEHIRTRLIQTGFKLAKGSPEGQARWFVRRWSDEGVRCFYILVKEKAQFLSHKQVGELANCSKETSERFWRSLLRLKVAACFVDSLERAEVSLFRRGHEMTFSGIGVKLQVRTEMMPVSLAQIATDTTRGQLAASIQNYEGACKVQEAAANDGAPLASTARALLQTAVNPPEVEKQQRDLFGTGGES